jgi:hypothetical protein
LNQWLVHRVEQETGVGHWTYVEPYFLLQGLWKRLINLSGAEDPLSSSEYGTIFALIESDVEGIGGSGLVECLREHIQSVSMNYSWEPLVVLFASLFLLRKMVCMCVGLAM